jgi:hypothetical protein
MKLYVAADYDRREEAQMLAADLRGHGHKVIATWLDGEPEDAMTPSVQYRRDWADRDIKDIWQCEGLVVITEERGEPSHAGHHFETGFCHAHRMPVFVLGPSPTCFYDLFPHYQDVEGILRGINGWIDSAEERQANEAEALARANKEQERRARESRARVNQYRVGL